MEMEVQLMASWEPSLVAAITRAVGGENPIETIDHEAKFLGCLIRRPVQWRLLPQGRTLALGEVC